MIGQSLALLGRRKERQSHFPRQSLADFDYVCSLGEPASLAISRQEVLRKSCYYECEVIAALHLVYPYFGIFLPYTAITLARVHTNSRKLSLVPYPSLSRSPQPVMCATVIFSLRNQDVLMQTFALNV
jgi:hypothetical protein